MKKKKKRKRRLIFCGRESDMEQKGERRERERVGENAGFLKLIRV